MKIVNSDSFIPVIRAALKLGLNPRWLANEAKAGRVPAIDCGGSLMVNLVAVREALADRAAVERVSGAHGTGTRIPPIPEEVRNARD